MDCIIHLGMILLFKKAPVITSHQSIWRNAQRISNTLAVFPNARAMGLRDWIQLFGFGTELRPRDATNFVETRSTW